jgi:hypothetical protein
MFTVPAVKRFPELVVVLEKAEYVAGPAIVPTAMTTRSVTRIFRRRVMSSEST